SLAGETPEFPEEWADGLTITMRTPNSYTVTSVGEYDRISGPLADLGPFPGMKVTLSTDVDYDLVVANYSPYVPPVPGSGGSPSAVQASASPTTYDFAASPAVWTITYRGNTRTISLASNFLNMSGLVSAITSQLDGMGLTAQDNSGRLLIAEPSSPYRGGTLSQSNAPVAVFGVAPVYTVGSASAGGVPEQPAYIELNYDNGTPFAGLEDGSQRLSLGYRSHRFTITGIDGLTMTVQRLTDAGLVDTGWAGFTVRTLLDFSLGADGASTLDWLGPFMAVPEQELTDTIEYDFYLPGGLAWYKSNGHRRAGSLNVFVEWRDAAIGGAWTREVHNLQSNTEDAIGFTFRKILPYKMRPQYRV
ncbi:phage tail protein, partial [Pseudomonas putida]|nr:phage tail protein [Pseudomonas putida]